ncbi:fructosamine kinase family protein [Streptomyces sp. NP160]|uniref:fructosamine kinase family protein n=1 Tax=Streptomyces sp. NP160 TaxID=2586637 RepID=UPI00111ADA86|nr:fructosamine kinase family protein [Streptomyces sp. NP160]TNM67687.1 fructosamine kinase family protein [Streptomyces sp. NP160]
MTAAADLLLDRLRRAGMTDVVGVAPTTGGLAATAGIARRADGSSVFVKTFADPPSADAFQREAAGLEALRGLGGLRTPEVLLADEHVLVLEVLAPRPAAASFWTDLAHDLARLHTTTVHHRFGWDHDNWLGRRRQVNTWTDDGFAFFAQHRLLRWFGEPRVRAALGPADRAALERLCDRLPELLPDAPACLTHGDLWTQNVLSTAEGRPAVIDPAVSFTWAEVDLAHLWTTAPPPGASAFFDRYAELTGLDRGWRDRMPVLQLRQHLAVIAQFDDDWGAADTVRATLAPFRSGPRAQRP